MSRTRTVVAAVTTPVAVIAAGALVYQASWSAFTAETSNPDNNWAAGSVTLTDDDANAAAFTVTNIAPGQSGTKCIKVDATTGPASTVKMYAADATGDLAPHITVSVDIGTGGTFANCTGFTPDAGGTGIVSGTPLSGLATTFATGYGTFDVPANSSAATKTYRIAWTFPSTIPQATLDGLQGDTGSVDFVWQLQTN